MHFTSLYQCMAVHQAMGTLSEFFSYLIDARRKQISLFKLNAPANAGFFDYYSSYFLSISGYFIIDSVVFDSSTGFAARRVLGPGSDSDYEHEQIWKSWAQKLKTMALDQCRICRSAMELKKIKEFLYYLMHSLKVRVSSILFGEYPIHCFRVIGLWLRYCRFCRLLARYKKLLQVIGSSRCS